MSKAGRTPDRGSIQRPARPFGLQTESIPEHSHSHSPPHSSPNNTEPLSFYNFNYLGPLPRDSSIGPTTHTPSLPPNTPITSSATAPIPRGAASKPRPMSLPPTSYAPSYSGTSSERPRQYVEQPLASAQRHSQRGLEPTKQRTTNRILGDYTLSKTLGAGSMGKVKLAHHNVTGEKVRITFPLSFFQARAMQERIFFPLALSLGFKTYFVTITLIDSEFVHRGQCCSPSLMVSSATQTAQVSYPCVLIRAVIIVTSILLPFFFLLLPFVFLFYSANRASSPYR
jgi:hypothetical protein